MLNLARTRELTRTRRVDVGLGEHCASVPRDNSLGADGYYFAVSLQG